MAQATHQVYTPPAQNIISVPIYNYRTQGGSAVWRLRGLNGNSVGGELFDSVRNTKWFKLKGYDTSAQIRRISMSYRSQKPIQVYVYKDFENLPCHVITFKKLTRRGITSVKASARAKCLMLKIQTASWVTGGVDIYGMEVEIADE
tara:strand:+ start:592 stop:1029 length:438 start_codon:yes stop_codon:yes gene_type:complete